MYLSEFLNEKIFRQVSSERVDNISRETNFLKELKMKKLILISTILISLISSILYAGKEENKEDQPVLLSTMITIELQWHPEYLLSPDVATITYNADSTECNMFFDLSTLSTKMFPKFVVYYEDGTTSEFDAGIEEEDFGEIIKILLLNNVKYEEPMKNFFKNNRLNLQLPH